MRRAQQLLGLRVHTYHQVTGVQAQRSATQQQRTYWLTVESRKHSGAGGEEVTSTTRAEHVVLAFGAASFRRDMDLPAEALPHVSSQLGTPSLYASKHVVVVGTGPSGMESAIRVCNYGAAHVTLLTRGTTFKPDRCKRESNVYLRASYCRIQRFLASGKMTVDARDESARRLQPWARRHQSVDANGPWAAADSHRGLDDRRPVHLQGDRRERGGEAWQVRVAILSEYRSGVEVE